MNEVRLLAALAEIREALQADGADLNVVGMEGTTAHVQLLLGSQTCHECIMPKDFLEEMILTKLRESTPELARVELDDPRFK